MNDRPAIRPGGRSARVQAAVHQATRELQQEIGRDALTVPAIAMRAGVTPSTIYRRWGDLARLLADVALEQMQPEQPPADTGSFRGDILAWLEQYVEETSSTPGRSLLRDVLCHAGHENAGKCDGITRQQIDALAQRAAERGETPPATGLIIERVLAPLLYRILFANVIPTAQEIHALYAGLDAAPHDATGAASRS
ncbi:TetR family transcriptional regulator [Bordetella trematum]|uniref:Bacterial regulatory proteins, tetR family n=1 Tax=Bordetella trematum TaxID=123899 RepID=A0A157PZQ1_9BORD|nr:TetR/AcrR family transcriptional regulator [Bordetella trematum]AUL46962.1 TetR family transcriptional regulator [Bordetella trematum]AZR93763.1 TetR family transcriptional regulator [Bordetella trematum]NNH21026.1 TetR/AcrR family transcriptional regulator [Bordetella trematum]QIM72341.1 TetR/AcrR family transcriptional regulator [Bordetella trematum]SAH99024.1 Bacterial regulatory proteins%2C tetR family [Bordetella trematum]